MNEDQRSSHPEPFVFIDHHNKKAYKAMRWSGEWWLFYWHDGQKSWVSLRRANGEELARFRKDALPHGLAKLYDELHDKFTGGK